MKLKELVAAAKADRPKVFATLNDKRIVRLAQAILDQTGRFLAQAADGKHQIEGLGRVLVKQVEVTKNGEKVKRKRIVIRPKENAGKKAAKKAAKKKGAKAGGKVGGKGGGKGGKKGAAKKQRRQAVAAQPKEAATS